MNKQQALNNWMTQIFPKGCNKVSVLKGRRSFVAGWEACEDQQSPTDAESKLRSIQEICSHPDTGREGCTYNDTTYDSLSVVYGYNTALEHIQEVLNRPASNPSGAAPKFKCPSCGNPWDTKINSACECGATITNPSAPQPAGPVWVKCPDCGGDGKETCHNPDHGFISAMPGETGRLGCPVCGHDKNHKVNSGKNKCYTCDGNGKLMEQDAIKWAHDNNYQEEFDIVSTPSQQLFTREQVELAYVAGREDWQIDGHPYLFEEYMNTNYPTI